jgi:xanthine/CO dehydrogenase XdhC/CoxF family maturation factor
MHTNMRVTTTEGEDVFIVSKEITDGARPAESQILTAADGRTFRPLGGGQVEEITVMDGGEADVDDASAMVEEIPESLPEQAAEAPAGEEDEEDADSQV